MTITALYLFSVAQENLAKRTLPLPSVQVKTLNGANFNTKDIDNEGKPIIICFFATHNNF